MTSRLDPRGIDPEGRGAATVLALVTNFADWVHRRVESVTLLDDVTIRRDVSIDFTVPNNTDKFGETNELPWVPLTFLEKDLLRNFDLRDSAGTPVPMLTRAENSAYASNALVASARAVLNSLGLAKVPSSVRQELIDLVGADAAEAEAVVARWRAGANVADEMDGEAWSALLASEGFLALASTLATNFVMFAVTPAQPGHRQILKFSYEERYDDPRPLDVGALLAVGLDRSRDSLRRVWEGAVRWPPQEMEPPPRRSPNPDLEAWKERASATFGWRVKTVVLSMPAANLTSSFHVEVPAPPDMEIDSAQLRFSPRDGEGEPGDGSADSADGILIQRAHLYASQVPTDLEGEAVVHLRARRQGFLRSSVSIGWLTVILLWTGYAFFDDLTRSTNSQTAAALLLIVTTLLNSALIRPGEHRLVARVLLGVRLLLALGIFCTFIAVGVLAGVGGEDRATVWLAASILDTLVAGLLTFSYRLPRPVRAREVD
jgi:hypothetical protein